MLLKGTVTLLPDTALFGHNSNALVVWQCHGQKKYFSGCPPLGYYKLLHFKHPEMACWPLGMTQAECLRAEKELYFGAKEKLVKVG